MKTQESEICFDLAPAEFISPFGVTVIAGTIKTCIELGKSVYYARPEKDEVEAWLSSISFTRLFQVDEMARQARATSTELRQLKALEPLYIVYREPDQSARW